MPDPRPPRRERRSPRAERPDETPRPTGPLWARAVHLFYDPIFDIRSRAAFQAALNDYVVLPADERAFHETHLLFRAVQGLESIHGVLRRIEEKLDGAVSPDLSELQHLGPIREALAEIASNPPDLVHVDGWEGADPDDEEQDELGDDPDDEHLEGSDPDFIYDTVPDDEPARPPRPPRRAPEPEPPRPQPARAESPRPPTRQPDAEREALVGDLVPASEGPQGAEAGER